MLEIYWIKRGKLYDHKKKCIVHTGLNIWDKDKVAYIILILIVPVGVYQLCTENSNRLQPTLFIYFIKRRPSTYICRDFVIIG
jgi:hypothetical protein